MYKGDPSRSIPPAPPSVAGQQTIGENAKSVQSVAEAAGVMEVSDAAKDLDVLTGRLDESVREFELGTEADGKMVGRSPVESPEIAPGGDGHQAP